MYAGNMNNGNNNQTKMLVTAKSGGDASSKAKPGIWTERMMSALERGLRGGVWYSLIDKVYQEKTLEQAWNQVRKNRGSAGIDRMTVERFGQNKGTRLRELGERLKSGMYYPQAVKRVNIPKEPGKTRPLGIPCIIDRVVQGAIRLAIEPIFEHEFSNNSYGFRPGKSAKDALRRVDKQLKEGYKYVVDVDLENYFETIPHDKLISLIWERLRDGKIRKLIEAFLNQQIMEDCKTWTPTTGTPQGGVLSPLLANIYLNPLDHLLEESGYQMTRYADDCVVLCKTQEEAESALKVIQDWVTLAGLKLHPIKTKIVDMANSSDGFDFLGYRFVCNRFKRIRRIPRKKSLKKYKDAIRQKTRRASGYSMDVIIENVNKTSRGWYEYFKQSAPFIFKDLDGWVRMRLRSILRKRRGIKGRGQGRDHHRWPNSFFVNHGLFTMVQAHRMTRHAT